ncbi:hypothetical protein [uncultured Granulicatella sp.]|uniref:hypothetical protein n=1 Tax=uncultured Granulicatella sp. TaxID=316089 RepID=UPI0028CFFA82|nr:hypothetical protein [uncultured Granulicatella sp.]
MENIDKLTNELKDNISKVWRETKENIGDNIFRERTRSISSDVEDAIAVFTSSVLENKFEIYIDPSVTVNKKINRTDFLIIKDGIRTIESGAKRLNMSELELTSYFS